MAMAAIFSVASAQSDSAAIRAADSTKSSPAPTSCIRIVSPRQGAIITAPMCTLEVESDCARGVSIALRAQYSPADKKSIEIMPLGTISREPYKVLWDLSNVPNQFFAGVTFYAEAKTSGDSVAALVELQGVFLAHRPLQIPSQRMWYYGAPTIGERPLREYIRFQSSDSLVSARVLPLYDSKGLRFQIKVESPLFTTSLPQDKLTSLGVAVLIDCKNTHRPYPTTDECIVVVPLSGEAFRLVHEPVSTPSGSFEVRRTPQPYTPPVTIKSTDFRGYTVEIQVPNNELPAGGLADSIAFNAIVKYVDRTGKSCELAWGSGVGTDLYSPITWGTLQLDSSARMARWALLFFGSFGGTLALTFLVGFVIPTMRKRTPVVKFEESEEAKTDFIDIAERIQNSITKKDLSVEMISSDIKLETRAVGRLVKKFAGESFTDYLMRSRVELAKERLRSSHTSEAFVADSSGFKSVAEMEKYFVKFAHTSPYKFRQEFHVS
jgi:AraC-like DNA-binding protein